MNKLDEPTTRVHAHLFTRDLDRIQRFLGGRLSRNAAIRQFVRQMLDRIEARAAQSAVAPAVPPLARFETQEPLTILNPMHEEHHD